MLKWKDIKKKLPEDGQYVIGYDKEFYHITGIKICRFMCTPVGDLSNGKFVDYRTAEECVGLTHWIEIPNENLPGLEEIK